jgi:hypothetical protein
MKRLFVYGLLAFGIYYMFTGATGIIGDMKNDGTALVLKGLRDEELHAKALEHYKTVVSSTVELYSDMLDTTITDVNDDGRKDVIAIAKPGLICNEMDCPATIFIENERGELKSIILPESTTHIEVLESLTNGMHDLHINRDELKKLVWDGGRYVYDQI